MCVCVCVEGEGGGGSEPARSMRLRTPVTCSPVALLTPSKRIVKTEWERELCSFCCVAAVARDFNACAQGERERGREGERERGKRRA